MNLIYQAYGHQDILEQTLFSVISLLHQKSDSSDLRAVIYTDQPEWFQKFLNDHPDVSLVTIDQARIQKWRGDIDFVHRVKIEVLHDAGIKFDGPIFYCDGDTFFKVDPTSIFTQVSDEVSLMHIKEAALGKPNNPLTKKIFKFVKNNMFQLGDQEIFMGPETEMWNAGVIGLSQKNKSFFKDILNLTDQMYTKYPKHVMEQLAVSYVLQTRTRLISAENEIYHYWNQKPEYQLAIQRFLGNYTNIETALAAYEQFNFPEPPKPKARGLKKILESLLVFANKPKLSSSR